ncbi:MAG: ankyrin repeat domain-containing protein [Acidobacteriota bacterium]|nr:ankyrin repeat domain-containing protein [Acidobacteriota bacterium]
MSPFDELLQAVYRHDPSAIGRAIQRGTSVHDSDMDGRTALIHAILDSEHDLGTIRCLLDLGSDVNHADAGQNWTSLAFAARDQKPDVVRLLLDYGADVDPRDAFGNTPLWRAVFELREDTQVVNLLLTHGANPNAENTSGVSPLDLAETTGKTARIKWERGISAARAT